MSSTGVGCDDDVVLSKKRRSLSSAISKLKSVSNTRKSVASTSSVVQENSVLPKRRGRKGIPRRCFREEVVDSDEQSFQQDSFDDTFEELYHSVVGDHIDSVEGDSCNSKKVNKPKRRSAILGVVFECNVCVPPKVFSRRQTFEGHLMRHAKIKKFSCQHCDRSFTTPFELKNHSKIHSRGRPKKIAGPMCMECGKQFRTKSNLSLHMITHSQVKPFPCNLCSNSFCTKQQLVNHLRTHQKYNTSVLPNAFPPVRTIVDTSVAQVDIVMSQMEALASAQMNQKSGVEINSDNTVSTTNKELQQATHYSADAKIPQQASVEVGLSDL